MDNYLFLIKTKMEEKDYRKFLYFATFCKTKLALLPIILIPLAGSFVISYSNSRLNLPYFLILFVVMLVVSLIALCLSLERKARKRVKTDKSGAFNTVTSLKFYEDKLVMSNSDSCGTLKYDKLYEVIESKSFYLFYLSSAQASLVRKQDIENGEEFRKFIVTKFAGKYRKR